MVLILISTISVFTLHNSCKDKGTHPEDVAFVLPDSNLSFYSHIEPMFEAKCGFDAGCHSPTDTENYLFYGELITKTALMNHQLSSNGEKLVDLNIHRTNPHLAPLYLIVKEGYPRSPQDRMPPYYLNRAPLTENQINGIRQWIKEGAKD